MAAAPGGSLRAEVEPVPAVVIAVVNEAGLNVLHSDFAASRTPSVHGRPRAVEVNLPNRGTWRERLDALEKGALGAAPYGVLYSVAATRIVGIYNATPPDARPDEAGVGYDGTYNFLSTDRYHGTAVVSSAAGRKHGTDPAALIVFVNGTEAFTWLSEQRWIDFAVTSHIGLRPCSTGPGAARFADTGRITFSAAGNGEGLGMVSTPSGDPSNYIVGGVHADGRTYPPHGRPVEEGRIGASNTPNRPYETGELFSFKAADGHSFDRSHSFGGTSGAAPRTAGDAALILRHARSILGSTYTGVRDGKLARLGPAGHKPARGPLADGDFTRSELIDLLHHTAVPFEPPSPGRYMMEGYGAIRPESIELAKRILEGRAVAPDRSEEDAAHAAVTAARRAMFPEARCADLPA